MTNPMFVTSHALKQAAQFKLSKEDVQKMAKLSAVITHELGNRRFENYVFYVENGSVNRFYKVDRNGVKVVVGDK